jgi:hypothetical protein
MCSPWRASPTAAPQTYQYAPLDEKLDRNIRLLTLYPLLSPNTINCTLTTYELVAAPSFDALSYTWGSEIDAEPINIDGCPLLIRRNLWCFLRYLCATQVPEDGKLLVWADAICIDQQNVSERNHQVGLMGNIYSYAKSVIAWIRVAYSPKDSLTAGLTYKRLLSIWRSKRRRGHVRSVGGWPTLLSKKFRSEWMLFHNLCKAKYWSRTWIIQEILLAKKIQMIVEEEEISWDLFNYPLLLSEKLTSKARISITMSRRTKNTPDLLKTFESLPMRMASQRARTSSIQQRNEKLEKLDRLQVGSTPLLELLRTFDGSKCMVILDKVYALLSLSSDCRDFPVDYSTSPAQLCLDLYRHFRPTRDIEGFITTVAGILHVESEESRSSIRRGFHHKVALAVGYYPQCREKRNSVWDSGCAVFRRKGKILGILPEEKWDCTRKRLPEAAYRSNATDDMLVKMVTDCLEAELPKGYFDPICASLHFASYSNTAGVLRSRVKFGDPRIALVKIDECLFFACVCPAAEVGNMFFLVEGSRAALIVRNDDFGVTLIGMAALPVRGKIDASSKALDGVAFQDGPAYQSLSPYWIRQRMAPAITEEDCRELKISYEEADLLSRAEILALQDPRDSYSTRKRRRMEYPSNPP